MTPLVKRLSVLSARAAGRRRRVWRRRQRRDDRHNGDRYRRQQRRLQGRRQGRPGDRPRRPQRPQLQHPRQPGRRAGQVRPRRQDASCSRRNADYVPNLGRLVQAKYDLVIAVGFLMADPVKAVAKKSPDTHLAIIDFSRRRSRKPKNVRGLLFKEQEAGYLAGDLAGLSTKQEGGSTARDRLGRRPEDPAGRPLHRRLRGGGEEVRPGVQDANAYSQDFVDQAKCKEPALDQIAAGSHVVFQVAGQCGLGALDAAKEQNVLGHRRGRRPGVPRAAHPHERGEEGRRRRLRHDQAVAGRQVPGRRRTRSTTSRRRRRARQDRPDVPAASLRKVATRRNNRSSQIKDIPEAVN